MKRTELTELLLPLMADDNQLIDPKKFVESLDDENFDSFAKGYLRGLSVRLKRYEQLLGVKLK